MITRIQSSKTLSKAEMKKAIKVQKNLFPKGINACGTDALRFTLCSHNPKGSFGKKELQETCHANIFLQFTL